MTVPIATPDDRAVSSAITTVLAVGITGIVISGLLIGISSFTEGQQERAVRDQLETIGNRLADEHARVSQLVGGGNVSITTRHPDRVGGTRYSVTIVNNTATECDSRLVPSGVARCLELDAQDPDVTVYVPLRATGNTTVSIEDQGDGAFRLTASGGNSTVAVEPSPVALDAQTGVGQNLQGSLLAGGSGTINEPPLPGFEVSPAVPQSGVPTEFDASGSSDPDGSIVTYEWDFDGDGTIDATGEQASKTLGPGRHRVTLTVIDDDAGTATLSKNVSVSGLEYNDDLSTTDRDPGIPDNDTVVFTVNNTWNRPITLSALFVDPGDDSISRLNNDSASYPEVAIDTGDDGSTDANVTVDSGATGDNIGIPSPGLVINLDQPSENTSPGGNQTIPANTKANITIGNFNRDLAGERIDFAIDYIIDGGTNTTTFTYAAAPNISDYDVVASGQDVDVIFDSSQELDTITVEVSGPVSKTLTRSDFTETVTGTTYTYQADVSSGTSGTFYANLTGAISTSNADSPSPPINKSATTDSTAYVWKTQIDWNNNQDEAGVVHDSFGDRPGEDVVRLGYPSSDRGGSNLVGYWTFDEGFGDIVADVTGNGNDAERRGEGNTDDSNNTPIRGETGLHGTDSWEFNTEPAPEEDAVYVTSNGRFEGGSGATVTATAWINPSGGSVQNDAASIVGKQEDGSVGDWGVGVRENCPGWASCAGNPPFIGYYGETGGNDYGLFEEVSFTSGWHHVATVIDEPNDEVRVYIDGNLVQSDNSASTFTAQTNHPVEIGRSEYQNASFEGRIDEVRVYDRTLNDSEIADLHATGEQGTFTTSITSGQPIDPNNAELEWSGDIPSATNVTVELRDGTDTGYGEVTLTSDSGTTSFAPTGNPNNKSSYYLVVELNSNFAGKTPEIDELKLKGP